MSSSIFYANFAAVRHAIAHKIPFFPVPPHEPHLPNISLPKRGLVVQTSGSTGSPKYAHLGWDHFHGLPPATGYLLSVPLHHVSGLAILFRTDDPILPGTGRDNEVTHASFVPTQLKRYLNKPIYPNLRTILLGGAPIPYDLCKEAYDKGFHIDLTYGMTEMASQVATHPFHPSTGIVFGHGLQGRSIKLVDGEIWVKGTSLFYGYLNAPSPCIDGWFPTNDLGRMGPNGLEVIGRKDRMLISGGENIYPEEIEKLLLSHPLIFSVRVSPIPDPEYGQRPIAHVATTLSTHKILDLLQALPRFKIPDQIHIVPPTSLLTKKG